MSGETHDNLYLAAIDRNKGWDVSVYVVNTSKESQTISIKQTSFMGDTDNLLELPGSDYKQILVPGESYFQIDHMDDAGQLDFTTAYTITIGDEIYFEQINGWSFSDKNMKNVPFLNEKGYFAPFMKSSNESIS